MISDKGSTVDHIDTDSLVEAQRLLGAERPNDAVNQALRETVRRKMIEEYLSFMSTRDNTIDDARDNAWR